MKMQKGRCWGRSEGGQDVCERRIEVIVKRGWGEGVRCGGIGKKGIGW